MIFSKTFQRWNEDYKAEHQGLTPDEVTWYRSYDWDRDRADQDKLFANEPDVDRLCDAYDLAVAQDFASALKIWHDLAAKGSAYAMVEIAGCYASGCTVSKDPVEAERWYKRAFLSGSQPGMLGYARTVALRKDYKLCEQIVEVGVRQDWTPAIFWQAWYQHKQSESPAMYRAILPALRKAARRGHPAARMILSSFMVRGKFGIFRIPLGFLLAIKNSLEETRGD